MASDVPLTPSQCRGARGLLDWSQEELARGARVSRSTVRNFEMGRRISARAADDIKQALARADIVFIGDRCTCEGRAVSMGVAVAAASEATRAGGSDSAD